jgi:CHASE3 domain sensor protein
VLSAAFGVALACLLLAGIGGIVALHFGIGLFRDVLIDDIPLLKANAAILQGLTDAETSERGFLITGDDASLQPYEPGRAAFERGIARARGIAETSEMLRLIAAQEATGHAVSAASDASGDQVADVLIVVDHEHSGHTAPLFHETT